MKACTFPFFYEVHMTSEQAFKILGITDRNIDESSLRRAFHEAARQTHPDSNPEDANAQDKFNIINEAYKVLCEYLKYEQEVTYNGKKVYAYDWTKHTTDPRPKPKREPTESSEHAWEKKTSSSWRQEETDPWDKFAEADRQFAKERQRQTEAELRRQEKLRNLKVQAEYYHQKYLREEKLREEQQKKQEEQQATSVESKDNIQREKTGILNFPYLPEVAGGAILLLGMIALILVNILTARDNAYTFMKYSAMLFGGVIILMIAYRLTCFVGKNRKDIIISIIIFLATVELGIAIMKIVDSVFKTHKIVETILVYTLLWGYEFVVGKRELKKINLKDKTNQVIIHATLASGILSTVLGCILILMVVF